MLIRGDFLNNIDYKDMSKLEKGLRHKEIIKVFCKLGTFWVIIGGGIIGFLSSMV